MNVNSPCFFCTIYLHYAKEVVRLAISTFFYIIKKTLYKKLIVCYNI